MPQTFADYVHRRIDRFAEPSALVGNLGGGRAAGAPPAVHELVRNLDGYRAAAVAYVLAPTDQSLPGPAFTLVLRSPTTRIYRLAGAAPYLDAPGCTVDAPTSDHLARVDCPAPGRASFDERPTIPAGPAHASTATPPRSDPVDGLFQAITVPAGAHHVTFAYTPSHIGWAYAAFAVGVLSLLVPLLLTTLVAPETTAQS